MPPTKRYVLALDQGTTSSRAILFDHSGRAVAMDQQELRQILPRPGWVEHDANEIWSGQLKTARHAIASAGIRPDQIAAVGITNQRETTILWDRQTGQPVAHAVVWQSRASADICQQLKEQGHEPLIRERTGLVLDPYFSATKIRFLLESVPGLRHRAERGEILFGTVDSYLIWQLTEGRAHVTDVSNASRTLLMDLKTCQWDEQLLRIFDIPAAMLPKICDSSQIIGQTQLFGESIPIGGCAGDQQAALFGQACFEPGSAKNTYGTGCFLLMNTGEQPIPSKNNLLTSVAWSIQGKATYCLEGAVFVGGAAIQWLRDGLGVIERSEQVEQLIANVDHTEGVYFVPALVGLGAPHWDPHARGTIVGLTRGTHAGHIALAAVESMAFQSRDVLLAMQQDARQALPEVTLGSLRVDGGASVNDRLMQFQADILDAPVVRPQVAETTALGAAYLAGLAVGFWEDLADVQRHWRLDRQFEPEMDATTREQRCSRWDEAVRRSLNWDQSPSGQ